MIDDAVTSGAKAFVQELLGFDAWPSLHPHLREQYERCFRAGFDAYEAQVTNDSPDSGAMPVTEGMVEAGAEAQYECWDKLFAKKNGIRTRWKVTPEKNKQRYRDFTRVALTAALNHAATEEG